MFVQSNVSQVCVVFTSKLKDFVNTRVVIKWKYVTARAIQIICRALIGCLDAARTAGALKQVSVILWGFFALFAKKQEKFTTATDPARCFFAFTKYGPCYHHCKKKTTTSKTTTTKNVFGWGRT